MLAIYILLCGNLGLTSEAMDIYASLQDFGVHPDTPHHNSVIYALAKAGRLKEAERIFQKSSTDTIVDLFSFFDIGRLQASTQRREVLGDISEDIRARPVEFTRPHSILQYVLTPRPIARARMEGEDSTII